MLRIDADLKATHSKPASQPRAIGFDFTEELEDWYAAA
jgi:hypothetical protein